MDNKENSQVAINRDSLSTVLYRLLSIQNDQMESMQKAQDAPTEEQVVNMFAQLRETRAHIHAMYEYEENATKIDFVNPS